MEPCVVRLQVEEGFKGGEIETILLFIVAVQRENSINQASKPSKIVSGVVAVGVGD